MDWSASNIWFLNDFKKIYPGEKVTNVCASQRVRFLARVDWIDVTLRSGLGNSTAFCSRLARHSKPRPYESL